MVQLLARCPKGTDFGEGAIGGIKKTGSTKGFVLTLMASLSEEDNQLSGVLVQWDMLVGQVSNQPQAEINTKKLLCTELVEFGIQLCALEVSIGKDTSSDPSSSVWSGVAEIREEWTAGGVMAALGRLCAAPSVAGSTVAWHREAE
jgi:hypothetical protein